MKKIYKIIIIVAALIPVVLIGGQVLLLVGSIQIGGLLVNSVSNSDFEKEMMQLDEVAMFHEKYPDPTVGHSSDIIAWKQIHYDVKNLDSNQSVNLFVKKSIMHGAIKMQISCVFDNQGYQEYHMNYEMQYQKDNMTEYNRDDSEFAIHLTDRDEISEYLKNEYCFEKR